MPKTKIHVIKHVDEEIDRNLAETAIDILKDPKINKSLGIDFKSIVNSLQKSIRQPRNVANPQNPPKDLKKDAG